MAVAVAGEEEEEEAKAASERMLQEVLKVSLNYGCKDMSN
jgi:hypothetical protein